MRLDGVLNAMSETRKTVNDLSRPLQVACCYWTGEHLVLRIPVSDKKAADYLVQSINKKLRDIAKDAISEVQGDTLDKIVKEVS